METCEVYITDVRKNGQSWVDDPDEFLDLIYDCLLEIPSFGLISVSVNMAEVFNVVLKVANYDSMLVYIKGITYKHKQFVSVEEASELDLLIRNQMLKLDGITIGEVQIRSSKIYSDLQLGLIERPSLPAGSNPVILESH